MMLDWIRTRKALLKDNRRYEKALQEIFDLHSQRGQTTQVFETFCPEHETTEQNRDRYDGWSALFGAAQNCPDCRQMSSFVYYCEYDTHADCGHTPYPCRMAQIAGEALRAL